MLFPALPDMIVHCKIKIISPHSQDKNLQLCLKTTSNSGALTCQYFMTVLTVQQRRHGDFLGDKHEQTFWWNDSWSFSLKEIHKHTSHSPTTSPPASIGENATTRCFYSRAPIRTKTQPGEAYDVMCHCLSVSQWMLIWVKSMWIRACVCIWDKFPLPVARLHRRSPLAECQPGSRKAG